MARAAEQTTHGPGVVSACLAVLGKDLRIELRTREVVTTTGFFAVLVALMASLAYTTGPETTVRVAPGTLWLAIAFSSILALGRSWQREREDGAFTALLVAPVPRPAIFLGKGLGVLAFLAAVEVILVPIVALLFHMDIVPLLPPLLPILALGTVGVAATGTLFGAMTVRTRARDLMLATVLFPLLSPTLLSAVTATRELLAGAPFEDYRDYLLYLAVFDAVAVAGGLGLFGPLVDD